MARSIRRDDELKIGDLERKTGVSRSSIAHYVRLGLLPPPRKLGPKLFLFDGSHVEALERVRRLRAQEQLPLAEIRTRVSASSASGGALARKSSPSRDEHVNGAIPPRRRAILEVATRLFARDGYEAVRLIDVARELGLSKAALYQSFESKEALFVECIDHIRLWVVPAEMRAAGKREQDPLHRAYLRASTVLAHLEPYRMLTQLLVGVANGRDRALAGRAQEAFHRMVTDVVPELREAVRAGLLREGNLELQAYVLWGALMGAGDYLRYAGDASVKSVANAYLELILWGTAASGGREATRPRGVTLGRAARHRGAALLRGTKKGRR
jgi:AcrR family transcriptional regulator/predicted DNA-binding transcriptional regulator AlpA